jgi:hypothetical protein
VCVKGRENKKNEEKKKKKKKKNKEEKGCCCPAIFPLPCTLDTVKE